MACQGCSQCMLSWVFLTDTGVTCACPPVLEFGHALCNWGEDCHARFAVLVTSVEQIDLNQYVVLCLMHESACFEWAAAGLHAPESQLAHACTSRGSLPLKIAPCFTFAQTSRDMSCLACSHAVSLSAAGLLPRGLSVNKALQRWTLS